MNSGSSKSTSGATGSTNHTPPLEPKNDGNTNGALTSSSATAITKRCSHSKSNSIGKNGLITTSKGESPIISTQKGRKVSSSRSIPTTLLSGNTRSPRINGPLLAENNRSNGEANLLGKRDNVTMSSGTNSVPNPAEDDRTLLLHVSALTNKVIALGLSAFLMVNFEVINVIVRRHREMQITSKTSHIFLNKC
jgi:hypothetical protein